MRRSKRFLMAEWSDTASGRGRQRRKGEKHGYTKQELEIEQLKETAG